MIEARQGADLASGPVTLSQGEVTLTLSVGSDGTPDLTVRNARQNARQHPGSAAQG
jgi:hypothetical protein